MWSLSLWVIVINSNLHLPSIRSSARPADRGLTTTVDEDAVVSWDPVFDPQGIALSAGSIRI
jgi:hypothetical protein